MERKGRSISTEVQIDNTMLKDVDILLAEDNKINQEMTKTILEHFGAAVTVADDGQAAVDAIKGGRKFDAVLMDVRMPKKDGYEAAAEIRGMGTEHTDKLPIFALTANNFQTDIDKSAACGMTGHIGKPIDPELLVRKIRESMVRK